MSLLKEFDKLMSHLNGEENGMAIGFRGAIEEAQDDLMFLDCLYASGVGNWGGYEYAQEDYQQRIGDSDNDE